MRHLIAMLVLMTTIAAVGQEKNPPTATSPKPPTSQPVTSQPAVKLDAAVEKILDQLEKLTVKDIETPLVFIKRDPILEDEQRYDGILWFKDVDPNPVFLVRFDRFTHEGVVRTRKEWHGFDGQWYTEAKEKSETILRKEIVRPGEKFNVFELGEGPFPLPFGQKKAQIVSHFSVKLAPPLKDDPKDTDHLICKPLPKTEMARKYSLVHFYINRKLNLPIRVKTVSASGDDEVIVDFPADKIQLNKQMPDSALKLPALPDYRVETERLEPLRPATTPTHQ